MPAATQRAYRMLFGTVAQPAARDILTDSLYRLAVSSITTELAELLATVRRPGDFFVSGTAEFRAPVLEVEGVGRLALPVLPAQAAQLAAVAEPAPYGRGEETVLDPTVRRSWQIGPERVRLGGRGWKATLALQLRWLLNSESMRNHDSIRRSWCREHRSRRRWSFGPRRCVTQGADAFAVQAGADGGLGWAFPGWFARRGTPQDRLDACGSGR